MLCMHACLPNLSNSLYEFLEAKTIKLTLTGASAHIFEVEQLQRGNTLR